MSRNLDYPVELACPHDGWYNGNPKLMIANGTFADYRHRLVMWVEKGKMKQSDLDVLDKQWAAIPLDQKRTRRNTVLEDIKKIPKREKDGKVEYVCKPSDNGRAAREERKPQLRRTLTHRQPLGSIDTRPDPLAAEETAALVARERRDNPLPPAKDGQMGHAIPDQVEGMVMTPPTRSSKQLDLKQQVSPDLAGAAV